jgi:hypothetical protein
MRRVALHGVVTQKVPFARPGARFTAGFEDLVVWLVTRSDKTTEPSTFTTKKPELVAHQLGQCRRLPDAGIANPLNELARKPSQVLQLRMVRAVLQRPRDKNEFGPVG